MVQPEGYITLGKEDWVWCLGKGLYGLVQAGRTWNEELNGHMESEEYTTTAKDGAICVKNYWTAQDFTIAGLSSSSHQ